MFDSIISRSQLEAMVKLALRAPPGDFVEVGVFKGGSAWRLYEVALAQGRRLHLFDSFVGTPVYNPEFDKHLRGADEFCVPDGTLERIERLMPMAKVYPGTFPFTLPQDGLGPLAFVHVDCDQYYSYKACIENLWPKVVEGGIMLFDDYPYLAGAKAAVEDVFDPKSLRQCHMRSYATKAAA